MLNNNRARIKDHALHVNSTGSKVKLNANRKSFKSYFVNLLLLLLLSTLMK